MISEVAEKIQDLYRHKFELPFELTTVEDEYGITGYTASLPDQFIQQPLFDLLEMYNISSIRNDYVRKLIRFKELKAPEIFTKEVENQVIQLNYLYAHILKKNIDFILTYKAFLPKTEISVKIVADAAKLVDYYVEEFSTSSKIKKYHDRCGIKIVENRH